MSAILLAWLILAAPGRLFAQDPAPIPEPGVLVSSPSKPSKTSFKPEPGPLVEIRAVDGQFLNTTHGRTRLGSLEGFGHGVIIDPAGIIATNNHVISGAQHIYVTLSDDTTYEANVLYRSTTDFCLVKINTRKPLKAIAMGNSSALPPGEPVKALAGINSGRIIDGTVQKLVTNLSSGEVEFLELKIPLAPGDSGGAIVDRQGHLMGLIMANLKSNNSIGYAIPSNLIKEEYLKYKGSVLVASKPASL